MRHTVRGIILKDKHVVLVTGHDADFYWTPGGGVEPGETVVDALHREIREELGVRVTKYTPYYTYTYDNRNVENFIIEVEGDFTVGTEVTGYAWYNTFSKDIQPSNGFLNTVYPQLVKDGLID